MKPFLTFLLVFLLVLSPYSALTPNAKAAPLQAAVNYKLYLPIIMNDDPLQISGTSITTWNLVWSDEFNGTSIDPKNWTYDLGTLASGNGELEYYTSRPQNSWVSNGALTIQANRENYQGSAYTSARMVTRGLWQFQYGLMEARMKLPYGQGIWPTFWMLGGSNWPTSGEVDIMEYIGRMPTTLFTTLHGPGYSGANGIGARTTEPAGTFQNDWHVYAIDWEPNSITWLLDGVQVFQVTSSMIPAGDQWVFNHPFYLLLNIAVGGTFPGNPDSTTIFPQQLQVDYVRVYQHP